jgi:hypothetical protein
LAQSGHGDCAQRCPLSGVKRTRRDAPMSGYDPKRTPTGRTFLGIGSVPHIAEKYPLARSRPQIEPLSVLCVSATDHAAFWSGLKASDGVMTIYSERGSPATDFRGGHAASAVGGDSLASQWRPAASPHLGPSKNWIPALVVRHHHGQPLEASDVRSARVGVHRPSTTIIRSCIWCPTRFH